MQQTDSGQNTSGAAGTTQNNAKVANLRYYIKQLMDGNSFFGIKVICSTSLICFMILHIFHAVLFLFSGAWVMLVINLICAVFYISVVKPLLDKESYIPALLVVVAEVIALVFFTTLSLGRDAGFTQYLFATCTVSFYFTYVVQEKRLGTLHALPLIITILILLFYFIDYFMMDFISPLFPFDHHPEGWSTAFYVINTLFTFIIMVVFSYLFVWEIRNKQRVLTEQNEKLDELAHKDPLTKLYNRRSMSLIIEQRMEQLKKSGKRFTIILGDIDDFKKVNDTYGHDAGDLVLKSVASTIMNGVRGNDAVCRWGGEEILILVSDPLETAGLCAERIRRSIESTDVVFNEQHIHITMTFGITESIPGYRIEHLIQQADDKLYYGKKHGKNQVVAKVG